MSRSAAARVAPDDDRLDGDALPEVVRRYPRLRFMGSKYRLLPWIHGVLSELDFETALDAFSGSGSVAYLMKAMGKRVTANDLLHFTTTIARATVENDDVTAGADLAEKLQQKPAAKWPRFIEETYSGIFFTREDLQFLDLVSANVGRLRDPHRQALAMAALLRSCVKRQPRGVFTIAGDLRHYDDGRRDLALSLREHFVEQLDVYSRCVFANGKRHEVVQGDVFALAGRKFDLVYLDPPYVPRADDNCYVKRYHFLEGLSRYWKDMPVLAHTKVRKIAKVFTPFSYRRTAVDAFDRLFAQFRASTIVLSYSSNGFPDLDVLVRLLRAHKRRVDVHRKPHTYHFGTHSKVRRASVSEYLIVGR
jgi:DNA adenine methylase/adenine-specific DNA-methyltransferase